MSAAFGAPIGGALFAYEISKPNTFWKFSVVWKVFFTCAIAVFTLAIFGDLMNGTTILTVSASTLKFGTEDIAPPTIETLPGCVIVGCLTGVLGGGFVACNSNLHWYRKKYITQNWMKLCEAILFSMMSTSLFYFLPTIFNDPSQCHAVANLDADNLDLPVQY